MADYQIFTLHSGGLALGSHTLRGETEETARDFCRQCLPEGGMAEIWSSERCVDVLWIAFIPKSPAPDHAARHA